MIYLTVTIDVEPDCSLSWYYSKPLTFQGVSIGIRERLQPLFIKYAIIPTYLINNVVLEDEQSVEIFRQLKGNFELGTHLHPEFIEPQKTVFDYAGALGRLHSCFYPAEIEQAKIENITQLFISKFGYAPSAFRAGRFSSGQNTYEVLSKLGYKIDTSVTPHIVWNDQSYKQPVDHKMALEQPYFLTDQLLEIPISIISEPYFSFKNFIKSMAGFRYKFSLHKNIWLRPVYSTYNEMVKLINIFRTKYNHISDIVLNMMFHNVEVLPSLSPYTITEADCSSYLNVLEQFFIFCNQSGIISTNLSSLYELYR
jgi:hypothetical protein